MLSPSEAQHRILGLAPALETVAVPLRQCNQRVLRKDVAARDAYPDRPRAKEDGYAVFLHRLEIGESRFHLQSNAPLAAHVPVMMASDANAVRVNEGDPLPLGADGVLPLSACRVSGSEIAVGLPPGWEPSGTVLPRGAWAQPGQIILEDGHLVQATHLACMAGAGVEEVVVSKPPRLLAIACGGNEPNAPALWALEALFQEWGGHEWASRLADTPEEAWDSVRPDAGLDLILLISRANRADPQDPLMRLLRQTGVELLVNGVHLSPGEDLLVARAGGVPLIVLPPRPFSALACARRFVWPLLDRAAGIPSPTQRRLPLRGEHPPTADVTRLLPCRWSEQGVETMPHPPEGGVASFAHTDGLMEVPSGPLVDGQPLLFFPWRRV